jgi:hypothetical protein
VSQVLPNNSGTRGILRDAAKKGKARDVSRQPDWDLKRLRKRAYSQEQFREMAFRTPFNACAIRAEQIGLDVSLTNDHTRLSRDTRRWQGMAEYNNEGLHELDSTAPTVAASLSRE